MQGLREDEAGSEDEIDEETYDDGEFYGMLLQEFLEQHSGDGAGMVAVSHKSKKKRKQVGNSTVYDLNMNMFWGACVAWCQVLYGF